MLEVAFHNPRQHKQFRAGPGPIVLACTGGELAFWNIAKCAAESPAATIEIVPQLGGISLAFDKCEAHSACGQACAEKFELSLPTSFVIGDTRFEIALGGAAPRRKLERLSTDKRALRERKSPVAGPSTDTLSRWFAALSSLNHWSTSLQQLYVQAARCAVEAIGLDGGIVLRRRNNDWEIAASYLPAPEFGIRCNFAELDELVRAPQTHFTRGSDAKLDREPAIVISPLRNAAGQLAGAVYGYRSIRNGNARRNIRYLEAHMIELLAGAVSEGIARIERQADSDRRRVLLQHAALVNNDDRPVELAVEEREVSLLFADLRGSTALSATLAPNETYELLSQVTECLTVAVIEHDGTIVDYYGDGLAAMWNAPAGQSDHAELACRAAMRMLETMPDISTDWAHLIERELQLGIGIHTGMVHVGNTGSSHRTKYGPRGANVNLANRIEAATKQLGMPLLVSKSVASRLSSRFAVHRVCHAQLPGFDQAIDLFGLQPSPNNSRVTNAWRTYSTALQHFEHGRMQEAADVLASIDARIREVPTRFLTEQVERELARLHRRRSSDTSAKAANGVVTLAIK